MTPLVRFLRRATEKLFGKWEEGPEPPQRLREIVVVFANMHPTATRQDWTTFAAEQVAEAYRCGYARGYEHAERDPAPFKPEDLADKMDPNWRWAPDVRLVDPLGIVQGEEVPDRAPTQEQLDAMMRRHDE